MSNCARGCFKSFAIKRATLIEVMHLHGLLVIPCDASQIVGSFARFAGKKKPESEGK